MKSDVSVVVISLGRPLTIDVQQHSRWRLEHRMYSYYKYFIRQYEEARFDGFVLLLVHDGDSALASCRFLGASPLYNLPFVLSCVCIHVSARVQ